MVSELWVTGDPIRDVYYVGTYSGNRFSIKETVSRLGGAANVCLNVESLLRNRPEVKTIWGPASILEFEYAKLIRLKSPTQCIEYWETKHNPINFYQEDYALSGAEAHYTSDTKIGLILSDYNKGMLTVLNQKEFPVNIKYEFILVDSRYRTLNIRLLNGTRTKIWHATGQEFDQTWAENFDWVIWTNGPGTVRVGSAYEHSDLWATLEVPNTKPVDTTGAGDTFTAAIGSYLSLCDSAITVDVLTEASKFAIDCCQEVIQQEYCAVTTKRL